MKGETDLRVLLANMSPELLDGRYGFLSFENAVYGDHSELEPIAAVQETEGLTLVVPMDLAEKYCSESGKQKIAVQARNTQAYRAISLTVHSSLDAVGLTAAFAQKLAECGISANVLAGYYHDHIYVPEADADRAMQALKSLSKEAQKN